MRRASAEDTLQDKKAYKRMPAIHRFMVCTYGLYSKIFTDPVFK